MNARFGNLCYAEHRRFDTMILLGHADRTLIDVPSFVYVGDVMIQLELRHVVVIHTCKKTQVMCRVRQLGQDTVIYFAIKIIC